MRKVRDLENIENVCKEFLVGVIEVISYRFCFIWELGDKDKVKFFFLGFLL